MATKAQHEAADRIAADRGCEILPTGDHRVAIRVTGHYQQGAPLDDRRIAECRAALRAAGIDESAWLS